jgi:hypothetical protein
VHEVAAALIGPSWPKLAAGRFFAMGMDANTYRYGNKDRQDVMEFADHYGSLGTGW